MTRHWMSASLTSLWRPRRLVLLTMVFAVLAVADLAAAGILGVGLVCLVSASRRRSRPALRRAVLLALVGTMAVGILGALSLPTYRHRADPLVVVDNSSISSAATAPHRAGAVGATQSSFEAMGFVVSDDDGAPQAVDQNVAQISTLAATGVTLGSKPGNLVYASASDALQRAHLNGASGLVVVSNYYGGQFDGPRAQRALGTNVARQRFASALSTIVTLGAWDGVVMDLERLPAGVRGTYPQLIERVKRTLGPNKRVVVALPAYLDAADPDRRAFDIPRISAAADSVVLMAYDQHELTSDPGPIAGLDWVKQTLVLAGKDVPARKLLLGVATYGYLWPTHGKPSDLTVAQARALPGVHSWVASKGEWHVTLPDGGQAWYDDSRSVRAHVAIARQQRLGGTAIWRLGAGDPLDTAKPSAFALLGGSVRHQAPSTASSSRPVEHLSGSGAVALTFDDGPDPTWTPLILKELNRLSVPATFFVVGTNAQSHPDLVRQEMAAGDVVGSHTYSHQDLSTLSRLRAEAEVLGANAVVEGITGRSPLLFRSPYGAGELSDAGSSDKDQLALGLGLHPVNWTVDALDWRKNSTPTMITQLVLNGATPRTVVLLHDGGGNRRATLQALPMIVESLRARGYTFTTVDALDGSITSPYADRHSVASKLRGLAIISAFHLDMATRTLALWILLCLGALATLRYGVAVPLALGHARRASRTPPASAAVPRPTVSVVIPAHNEERVLASTLSTVLALRPAPDEVIVVDDGSLDATAAVAARFPVRLITQPKSGKAHALNAAIGASTGDILVVLDADTQVDAGYLAAVLPHFADPRVAAVAGNVKVGNRQGLLPRLQALEYLVSLNLDRRAQAMLNTITVVPGAAGAFRRSALLAVGGFATDTLVEDADLTVSLLALGARIPYEPRALAFTEAPASVTDVLKQRRRWSYGTVQVIAKHRGLFFDSQHNRVGWVALPWMFLSQVLVPLLGPLIELYLLYLVVVGQVSLAGAMIGLALLADMATCAVAIALDREDWRLLLWVVPLRIVWRPLLLWSSASSTRRWLRGEHTLWRRLVRHGTVSLPATAPSR